MEAYIAGITQVEEGYSVGFLTPCEDALASLPANTTVIDTNSNEHSVPLTWSTTVPYIPYAYGNYTAIGTFTLPDGVSQSDPPTELQVATTLRIESGRDLMVLDWEGFNQPGEYVAQTVMFEDAEHTYYYYVPTSYDGTQAVPLVVDLHGGGSNGLAQWSSTRFDRFAEKEGFIVVAPNYQEVALTDRPQYLSIIIDLMEVDLNIDAARIYMCGISQGALPSASRVCTILTNASPLAPWL